jgi:DNA modification methylase
VARRKARRDRREGLARLRATLWKIDRASRSDGAASDETQHGTQKPVECMARPMRNHDAPSVYEPFAGSGTTIVAAEQLGRTCRAIEIDPRYVDVCVARWQRLTGLAATLDGDGRTFDQVREERAALQSDLAQVT